MEKVKSLLKIEKVLQTLIATFRLKNFPEFNQHLLTFKMVLTNEWVPIIIFSYCASFSLWFPQ